MFHHVTTRAGAKRLLILIALLSSCLNTGAQGVRLFTSADGIPSNRFICIHQDAEGYIWLGNDGGLSRMIGSSITTYYETPGTGHLKSNLITSIATDAAGQLWIGTAAGLQLFHPETDNFESIPLNPATGNQTATTNKSPFVSTMTVLPDGRQMLVSLGAKGLFVVDVHTRNVLQNETGTFRKALKQVVGRRLYCDSKQRLWIATNNGLVLMDLKTKSVKPLKFDSKSGINAQNLEITSILEDRKTQTLFFGDTKYSVLQYDEQENTIRPFSRHPSRYNNVQCLLQLKNGTMLAGCDRNGIGRLDGSTGTIQDYPSFDASFDLAACKVHQLMEDRWGNLYICLYQKGLLVVPSFAGGFRFRAITNGIVKQNSTAITAIVKSTDENLYVSTDGNGIFQGRDVDNMHRLPLPASCNGNIHKMLAGKDGRIWIATYGSGLYVLKKGVVESVPNQTGATNRNVSCLGFDKKQERLFIGNIGNGLNELNLTTGKMTHVSFSPPSILALYRDSQDRLWIGGSQCLVYDLARSKIKRLPLHSERNVFCFAFLEFMGKQYIGTNDGLYIYNESSNRIKHLSLRGRSGCVINAFARGRNNQLWMSSNLGLIRFDAGEETFHVFASYEIKKTGDFFLNSVLEQSDGSIVFGGDNGVITFNPRMLEHEPLKAEAIRLTTLSVDGKPVAFDAQAGNNMLDAAIAYASRIVLPFAQSSFSIGFSVFNYAASSKVRFKYRLENVEKQWNATSTDRPQAIYNQVPPGKYRLVIKSYNEEFDLPLSEKAIDIYVTSPWYWCWWSKMLYMLVVLGFACVVWYLYQNRLRSKKRLRALIGELLILKQNYQDLIKQYNSDQLPPQNKVDDKLKKDILRVISDNIPHSMFGVEELSREVAMSRVHLYRRTKELFNCSPNDLIKAERMKKAGHLLVQSSGTITEIAYQVGFSDSSYFARSFKSYYNMSPKAFIAKYRDHGDEEILKELFEI